MANLFDAIADSAQAIDCATLAGLHNQKNVWDYFGFTKSDFVSLSQSQKDALLSKFYFDLVKGGSIDASISSRIKGSDEIRVTKVRDGSKMEMQVEASSNEKKSKAVNLWSRQGFFLGECSNFNLVKANLPENTLMYVNQGYRAMKDEKKCYYNDLYIIGQIMSLAQQPEDVETYECSPDEAKILRALYDVQSGKFLGVKQCIALITVRDDPKEQFFDYGYDEKNNETRLYSSQKTKIPSNFKSTCFSFLKNQFEAGALEEKEFSEVFFYLPSTVDRSEDINKYMTMVHLRPVVVYLKDFGADLNPAEHFDRGVVVTLMKKIAEQSSHNLLRNADAFLSKTNHDNSVLIWPKGERFSENKFALTY